MFLPSTSASTLAPLVMRKSPSVDTKNRAGFSIRTRASMMRVIDPGEFVGPQMPVVSIVGDSQFSIEADVDEADISSVEETGR